VAASCSAACGERREGRKGEKEEKRKRRKMEKEKEKKKEREKERQKKTGCRDGGKKILGKD
jgi:hypothetical protein